MASSGSLLADKAFIGIEKSQLTHRRLCESKSHASDSHRSGEAAIFRGPYQTNPGNISTRSIQAGDKPSGDWIAAAAEDDRNFVCCRLGGRRERCRPRQK